eukprot:m.163791 g.163791  ORF g.163791 m.163791 type:complete len:251 (-) comp21043_c0_seq2:16-768(-)
MVPLRSCGRCLNNMGQAAAVAESGDGGDGGGGGTSGAKLRILPHCKFYLAFENSAVEDYVTEKFFEGVHMTQPTVMVYAGALSLRTYMPPIAAEPDRPVYIAASDFHSAEELGHFLQHLLHNQTAYNAYFAWRKTGTLNDFNPAFLRWQTRSMLYTPCKICVAAAEMQLARQILAEQGFEPQANEYHIARARFGHLHKTRAGASGFQPLSAMDLEWLYDLAYGRFWKDTNADSSWNDLDAVQLAPASGHS